MTRKRDKLQASVYDILPSTTAIVATGIEELLADDAHNESKFVTQII